MIPRDWIYEIPQKYCNVHGYGYLYQYNKDNLPEGTIVMPDGTIQLPGNILLMDDGSFMLPNGQIIPPQQNVNDYIESNPGLVNTPDSTTGELSPQSDFSPANPQDEIQPEPDSDSLGSVEDEDKSEDETEQNNAPE